MKRLRQLQSHEKASFNIGTDSHVFTYTLLWTWGFSIIYKNKESTELFSCMGKLGKWYAFKFHQYDSDFWGKHVVKRFNKVMDIVGFPIQLEFDPIATILVIWGVKLELNNKAYKVIDKEVLDDFYYPNAK